MPETKCECELAGYCKRHGAIKSQRLVRLCQTSDYHFSAWEDMAISRGLIKVPKKTADQLRAEQGRESWSLLHSMEDITPEGIDIWFKTIPAFGCKCKKFAKEYIEKNPPPYGADRETQLRWSWAFHDAVDMKTGDARMTYEEAVEIWMTRVA